MAPIASCNEITTIFLLFPNVGIFGNTTFFPRPDVIKLHYRITLHTQI